MWRVAQGIACTSHPADRGRFTFSDDGSAANLGASAGTEQAMGPVGRFCLFAATGAFDGTGAFHGDASFVSGGSQDYVEFYGSGCQLWIPSSGH